MGAALALYCLIVPSAPILFMAAGFGASALGDFLLDLPEDKGFLPGLIAFFAAHVAFLIYLWPYAEFMSAPFGMLICTGLPIANIVFYLWLRPSLPKDMTIPVAVYSTVITIMGIAALTTSLPSLLVPLGAALFIASDVVLSVEKFKTKFWRAKTINGLLYASGQILLAVGVVAGV